MRQVAVPLAFALALAAAPGLGAEWEDAVAPPEGATILLDAPPRAEIYAAPVRSAPGALAPTAPVEGMTRWRSFALADGGATLAQARRYAAALEALGFETLLDCAARQCGGFAFRAALQVAPPPEMLVNLADFHQLTMRRGGGAQGDADDGALVSVLLSRLGGRLHGQIVTVAQARFVEIVEARPGALEPAAPGDAAAPDPGDIGAFLDTRGFAVLVGVDFVAGSTELAEAAGPTLDAAASALAARPDLSVTVVGHTDDSGSLEANLDISRARATAVRAALIARGVAAGRVEAEGVGWLAPRASNADAAGRAANRRVELVAR